MSNALLIPSIISTSGHNIDEPIHLVQTERINFNFPASTKWPCYSDYGTPIQVGPWQEPITTSFRKIFEPIEKFVLTKSYPVSRAILAVTPTKDSCSIAQTTPMNELGIYTNMKYWNGYVLSLYGTNDLATGNTTVGYRDCVRFNTNSTDANEILLFQIDNNTGYKDLEIARSLYSAKYPGPMMTETVDLLSLQPAYFKHTHLCFNLTQGGASDRGEYVEFRKKVSFSIEYTVELTIDFKPAAQ